MVAFADNIHTGPDSGIRRRLSFVLELMETVFSASSAIAVEANKNKVRKIVCIMKSDSLKVGGGKN